MKKDMNGNPTEKGHAIWQVMKAFGAPLSKYSSGSDWRVIYESRSEEDARNHKGAIYQKKGYYLNARPETRESIHPYEGCEAVK